MKTIEIPPEQLAALREGADSVVVYLEDERLQGETEVCREELRTGCPAWFILKKPPQMDVRLLPPHSKGDVLACGESSQIWDYRSVAYCADGKWWPEVARSEDAIAALYDRFVDYDSVIPADQMPPEAARSWVRVEDVDITGDICEAPPRYPGHEPPMVDYTRWALTLSPQSWLLHGFLALRKMLGDLRVP